MSLAIASLVPQFYFPYLKDPDLSIPSPAREHFSPTSQYSFVDIYSGKIQVGSIQMQANKEINGKGRNLIGIK